MDTTKIRRAPARANKKPSRISTAAAAAPSQASEAPRPAADTTPPPASEVRPIAPDQAPGPAPRPLSDYDRYMMREHARSSVERLAGVGFGMTRITADAKPADLLAAALCAGDDPDRGAVAVALEAVRHDLEVVWCLALSQGAKGAVDLDPSLLADVTHNAMIRLDVIGEIAARLHRAAIDVITENREEARS